MNELNSCLVLRKDDQQFNSWINWNSEAFIVIESTANLYDYIMITGLTFGLLKSVISLRNWTISGNVEIELNRTEYKMTTDVKVRGSKKQLLLEDNETPSTTSSLSTMPSVP